MQLTERDIEILKFINEFGFCEVTQIERKFALKKPRCYQIMRRLTKTDLVTHERVFYGKNGVFYLTRKGAEYSDLPPIKNIPKDNYIHQLTIIEVYLNLKKQFPHTRWFSERRMHGEKSLYSVGKRVSHLADGILILPNDKQIAIEVELTMKSKERLEDIILSYALRAHIKEVWYFCSTETIERVRKVAGKWSHIKIFSLDERG